MELDDIDRGLLRMLTENARRTNNSLAEELGIAPSTCLARLNALRSAGVIRRFTLEIDPEVLGHALEALIFVKIRPGAPSAPIWFRFLCDQVWFPSGYAAAQMDSAAADSGSRSTCTPLMNPYTSGTPAALNAATIFVATLARVSPGGSTPCTGRSSMVITSSGPVASDCRAVDAHPRSVSTEQQTSDARQRGMSKSGWENRRAPGGAVPRSETPTQNAPRTGRGQCDEPVSSDGDGLGV